MRPETAPDTDLNDSDFSAPGTALFRSRLSIPATPLATLGNVRDTLFLSKGAVGTHLAWANASGATGYRVYRGTTASFMAGSPSPWTAAVANGTTHAGAPAPIFFYIVRATDGVGESSE